MKQGNLFGILLLSLFVFCCTSCSDENENPILLQDVENNQVRVIYPRENPYLIDVSGGSGNYSAICNNEEILNAELKGKTLSLTPFSVGDANVTIKDGAGNIYILTVQINYLEYRLVVIKHEVSIKGDNMTITEQKELEGKALATIPVQVDGGYKFVYTDMEQSKGDVYIYPEEFDGKSVKGTFGRIKIPVEEDVFNYEYSITIDDGNRRFTFLPYKVDNNFRSSMPVEFFQFCEDLTAKFKAEYENLEQVYASQVVQYKTKE